ncbi:TetR/AcrR family transcriptional regulator [Umezawaea tangerina]|uniref:TetR family transcriptional regulator n=1 Tax=Umezawaea tangerina TaxID=84725 RepID=A0A2T0SQC5_9PSEU|nr:TetR/AcrR family transcriptional regulator [Umezawaea tangerina]PRY35614.1 TetR family transcriptional regulator [Umezawaea tangerina]
MTSALSPRDRLLETASRLFYAEGIHTVPVDRLVTEADVTRATFYRHFPSKEDLVVAYLRAVDEELRGLVKAAVDGGSVADAAVAVLDLAGEATRGAGFRGCHFINAAAEYPDPRHPVRTAVDDHRRWFHDVLVELATHAGHPEPGYAAAVLVLLHDGALQGGDLDNAAAVRATLRRAVRDFLGS